MLCNVDRAFLYIVAAFMGFAIGLGTMAHCGHGCKCKPVPQCCGR